MSDKPKVIVTSCSPLPLPGTLKYNALLDLIIRRANNVRADQQRMLKESRGAK